MAGSAGFRSRAWIAAISTAPVPAATRPFLLDCRLLNVLRQANLKHVAAAHPFPRGHPRRDVSPAVPAAVRFSVQRDAANRDPLSLYSIMSKVKVLFFAADPLSTPPNGRAPRLLLDENVREIRQKVRAAEYRDELEICERWAVRTDDLIQALNEVRPQVVHFSGHGGSQGLVLVGPDGRTPHRVDAEALAELFQEFRDDVRVVVLSACFSLPQAQAIKDAVGCAIGTPSKILDEAAITFDASFYRGIAFGRSVQGAYNQAKTALKLDRFAEREFPQLLHRDDVDPTRLVLIPPGNPAAAPTEQPASRPARPPAPAALASGDAVAEPRAAGPLPDRRRVGGMRRSVLLAAVLAGSLGIAMMLDSNRGAEGLTPRTDSVPPGASASTSGSSDLAAAKDLHRAGNHDAAFPIFLRAALAGDHEAMGYTGVMYFRGEGTRLRLDSAYHWVHLAATGGRDARAMNALGIMYQTGQGVDRSLRWARHWYRAAAEEKGYAEAMRNLGSLFRDGQDYDSARIWYNRATRAGSLDATVDLGLMHEKGLGGPRNLEEARRLYQSAAEAGSPQGMLALGRVYQDGVGVARDYGQAREWYLRAVNAGSADAMNNLGVLYQNGWGVPANRDEAIRWYRRAAEAGSTVAAGNLALLDAG
jgi:TPR repeat protein